MYAEANSANISIPRTWRCLIGYMSHVLSLSPLAPEKRHGHYHGLSVFVHELHTSPVDFQQDLWLCKSRTYSIEGLPISTLIYRDYTPASDVILR